MLVVPEATLRTSDVECITHTRIARSVERSIINLKKLSQFSKAARPIPILSGENVQSHCSHLRVICLLPCFCLYGGFVIVSYCDFNFIFIIDGKLGAGDKNSKFIFYTLRLGLTEVLWVDRNL